MDKKNGYRKPNFLQIAHSLSAKGQDVSEIRYRKEGFELQAFGRVRPRHLHMFAMKLEIEAWPIYSKQNVFTIRTFVHDFRGFI